MRIARVYCQRLYSTASDPTTMHWRLSPSAKGKRKQRPYSPEKYCTFPPSWNSLPTRAAKGPRAVPIGTLGGGKLDAVADTSPVEGPGAGAPRTKWTIDRSKTASWHEAGNIFMAKERQLLDKTSWRIHQRCCPGSGYHSTSYIDDTQGRHLTEIKYAVARKGTVQAALQPA